MSEGSASPWLTLTEAAAYAKRSRRFLAREIHTGKLRGAYIGGRREILTCRAWLDQWVEDQAKPIAVGVRRRA